MPVGTACVEVVPWGTCARDIALPQTARRRSATAREPEAPRSSQRHLHGHQAPGHPNALAAIVKGFSPSMQPDLTTFYRSVIGGTVSCESGASHGVAHRQEPAGPNARRAREHARARGGPPRTATRPLGSHAHVLPRPSGGSRSAFSLRQVEQEGSAATRFRGRLRLHFGIERRCISKGKIAGSEPHFIQSKER